MGNNLIWKLSHDLARFREITLGHPMVMGRKTYESIGRPLPGRMNIIVTRDPNYHVVDAVVVHSVENALRVAENTGDPYITVIGGGEIFRAALSYATRLELTLIDAEEPKATTFFPPYMEEFIETAREEPREENGIRYQYVTFERKT